MTKVDQFNVIMICVKRGSGVGKSNFGEKAIGRVVMLENTQLNYDRARSTPKNKATRWPAVVVNFEINFDIKRENLRQAISTTDRAELGMHASVEGDSTA